MKKRIAQKIGHRITHLFTQSNSDNAGTNSSSNSEPISTELSYQSSKPGPKSGEAKRRVRFNAFVHGLTGQYLMINEDERPYYDAMAEDFRLRFRPRDGYEQQLLQKIVDTNWRLNVCAAVESAIFGAATVDQSTNAEIDPRINYMTGRAQAFIDRANSFQILSRYEGALDRRFRAMIAELEDAIAHRPQSADSLPAPELSEVEKHVVVANARLKETLLAAQASSKQTAQNETLVANQDSFGQTPKQQLMVMAAQVSAILEKSREAHAGSAAEAHN